jgi:hypothetical protein
MCPTLCMRHRNQRKATFFKMKSIYFPSLTMFYNIQKYSIFSLLSLFLFLFSLKVIVKIWIQIFDSLLCDIVISYLLVTFTKLHIYLNSVDYFIFDWIWVWHCHKKYFLRRKKQQQNNTLIWGICRASISIKTRYSMLKWIL